MADLGEGGRWEGAELDLDHTRLNLELVDQIIARDLDRKEVVLGIGLPGKRSCSVVILQEEEGRRGSARINGDGGRACRRSRRGAGRTACQSLGRGGGKMCWPELLPGIFISGTPKKKHKVPR